MPAIVPRAPSSPQLRFLLRASVLLVVLLALWWWVLLPPLLGVLRISADVALRLYPGMGWTSHITVDSAGNWNMVVPLPESVWRQPQVQAMFGSSASGHLVRVPRLHFAPAANVLARFTLPFPLFWGILLAAPPKRRWWRVAFGGTTILWLLGMVSLVVYLASSIGSQLHILANDFPGFLVETAEYLNLNVTPYMAPVLIAMVLHRELRWKVLSVEI